MSATTTTTPNTTTPTFDESIEQLQEAMNQSYFFDENGAPVDMDDEQKDGVEKTVEQVKNAAIETFGPLFTTLSEQINAQAQRIVQLQQTLANLTASAGVGSGAGGKVVAATLSAEDMEGLPTAEWLIANRKSKSGKDITGYNCFTMWYMAKNKTGFPPKGLWDEQNKAAWTALSKQVNGGSAAVSASSVAGAVAGAGTAAPLELPTTKGKGQKLTAYNMYTIDYMAKNPNQGFPPKGSWALVPKADVERYQAQADALKAQRA